MRIQYSNTILASGDVAVGRVGPAGLSWNGAPVFDVAQFFRADFATVFGRGDGPEEFSFSSEWFFASEAKVMEFCATHRQTLPVQGDLTLVDESESYAVVMRDAVRQVIIAKVTGVSVRVEYKFTGARFESDDVPDAPTDSETVKAFDQALTADTTEQAITYDSPFGANPRGITPILSAPDGGANIAYQIRESSRSASGFIVDFGAPVPASGYKLTGIAVL